MLLQQMQLVELAMEQLLLLRLEELALILIYGVMVLQLQM